MIEMPRVLTGPWTRQAREWAIAREARDIFIRYFRKAMKGRNWSPWNDLPLDEMRELGGRLSEDTVTIVEGYLGVLSHVDDYVRDGLSILRGRHARRNLHLAWGTEEIKHAEACELILLHSGRRTAAELAEYHDRATARTWHMRDEHPGLDTPLGIACYAMVQERATYVNFEALRKRIRVEYGLPEQPTEFERARGQEIGAAAACNIVADEDFAHHRVFLELVEISLRYLPGETLETLLQVFNGFKMPALSLIPNGATLAETLERTLLYTPLKYVREVRNPILAALGFEHTRALERAAQGARLLPDWLGPGEVSFSPSGEFSLAGPGAAT